MKLRLVCVVIGFLSLVSLTAAQTSPQAASALPRLVRFGGTVKDLNGSPLTGVVGITFAFYSENAGGAPLWLETQNASADGTGHYTVLLGSTKSEGLPADLFTTEQAVTGVRQDAYAKANPLVVEQEKDARLRGFYIHPELYGAPAEKQIEWARHPQTMKRMKEMQAKQLAAAQKQAVPRN